MSETTALCDVCSAVKPARLMRYNKCKLTGRFEYQCDICRALIKAGELEH